MNEFNQFSKSGKIERFEEEKEGENEKKIIMEVLQKLDSEKSRYALGGLYAEVSRLDIIRRTNKEEFSKLPKSTIYIYIHVKNLLKTFSKDIGLEPYGNVGEKFELTDDNMEEFELTGIGFEPGEKREVEIVSPGFTYKGETISLPKIWRIN